MAAAGYSIDMVGINSRNLSAVDTTCVDKYLKKFVRDEVGPSRLGECHRETMQTSAGANSVRALKITLVRCALGCLVAFVGRTWLFPTQSQFLLSWHTAEGLVDTKSAVMVVLSGGVAVCL
jgi:hypothetical protein